MIFDNLFELRTRQVVPTAANPLLGLWGTSTKSKTGIEVNDEHALSSTAVWSAVTQLSQAVASLPLHLYKRLKGGGKDKYPAHNLYNIMHLEPNPEMTSFSFREAQMGQILVTGTCFAEIERDKLNNIKGLWPLLTLRMETLRSKDNGNLFYRYQLPDGEYKIFLPGDILRVNGFSHSGLLGFRTVEKTKEAIALNLAYEEYAARFFGDGARPPIALEHPEHLGEKAQASLRVAFENVYGGLSNSQRVAILEEGMKLKEFGFSVRDSQIPELRAFQIDEVSRIFNIPPHMLHNLNRATFNNIEELSRGFVKFSLRYWLVRFEQAYNMQLLAPKERKKYFFEHIFEGLLRSDIKTRYEAYKVGIENGWLNADEVRELENMNPQPEEQGKTYYRPLNWIEKDAVIELPQVQQSQPINEEEAENEENLRKYFESRTNHKTAVVGRDRIIKQYYPLFKQAAQKIVNREAIAIKKAVKNVGGQRSKSDLKVWLDDFYDKHPDHIKREIGPVFHSFAEAIQASSAKEIGIEIGIDENLKKFISDYLDRYVERHVESSHGQLIALLEEELEKITERVDEWIEEDKRSEKIASNETIRESNAIYSFMAFGAGLGLYWRTRGPKTCPYCLSLEGRKISSGQAFAESGSEIKPKGHEPMVIRGTKSHPPLHRGCDCYISIY